MHKAIRKGFSFVLKSRNLEGCFYSTMKDFESPQRNPVLHFWSSHAVPQHVPQATSQGPLRGASPNMTEQLQILENGLRYEEEAVIYAFWRWSSKNLTNSVLSLGQVIGRELCLAAGAGQKAAAWTGGTLGVPG